ncbi:unnamed protein product [Trypanosoma congolense IL3000]|uniref:WGS project CAEQ00000000 data, annotated contig 2361 n=1 Tax=Trypanosoma congolense (strain IL3000) TaxID=1068625 RepID=F9WDG8_TRYCI|nr:unnamed protein product [Trypanosoma congolense IL3000]
MTHHGMFVKKKLLDSMMKDLNAQITDIAEYFSEITASSPSQESDVPKINVLTASAEDVVTYLRCRYRHTFPRDGEWEKQLENFCQNESDDTSPGKLFGRAWLALHERLQFQKALRGSMENINLIHRVVDVGTRSQEKTENESCPSSGSTCDSTGSSTKKVYLLSVHPQWSVHHNTTGRIYCSKPNLQTIPKKPSRCIYLNPKNANSGHIFTNPEWTMRHLYGPPPGCTILSVDFNQIELRVLAHLSGDRRLIEQLSNEYDVLLAITRRIAGIPNENAVPPSLREAIKVIVYGLVYGMGTSQMQQRIENLTVENEEERALTRKYKAHTLVNEFHAFYGVAAKYLASVRLTAFHENRVGTLTGSQDLSTELDGNRRKQHAVARALQGGAATIMHHVMTAVHRQRHQFVPNLPAAPFALVMSVHDELVYSVVNEYVYVVARKIKEIIQQHTQILSLRVPLEVSVRAGETLGSLKVLDI